MKKTFQNNIADNVERFTPTAQSGLSSLQVASRVESGLVNRNHDKYSKSYVSIFIGNICTFFNLLGLIVFISLLFAGAAPLDFVFVLVYAMNTVIGISQEIRAKKCIDRLSLISTKKTLVIRNGKPVEILPDEIVLDDVIALSLGNQVPTDCRILDGNVEVDESVLTGESVHVKKAVGDTLLSGSFIVGGNCRVVAEKVGKDNYVQKLSAEAKKYKKPHSELMESLRLIIRSLGFIIIPLAALYMIKSTIILNVELKEAVMRTSTLVIGMIPSGMFLLTSLALAVGIIKLAAHNTLIQDLYSLEMLARVDTICFDKTGTITDGHMTVKEVVPLKDVSLKDISAVLSSMLGVLNDGNQTAIALKERFGTDIVLSAISAIPFNSERKFSAVEFSGKGVFALGAPEFVLKKEQFKAIESEINVYASQGLRVLLLASSNESFSGDKPPRNFIPYALILLADNIRKDAITTVRWFKENGVAVKVISGDNPVTVAEVSKRVGIDDADKFISLEGLTDEEVRNCANKYTVFGRVTPEQKAILISSMKAAGHTTAMTGDGVNDILALKQADCAITVASGSEAARNIAHIVLLDNNFDSMPNVVFEGRRVINNIQCSASLYLMKTLFTLMLAFITLVLPFIEKYPFELRQMNLLELFIIGIPSFFLSLQPNKSRVEGKFLYHVIKMSAPCAVLMLLSVAIVEVFKGVYGVYSDKLYETISVYALTFSGLINLTVICYPFNKFRSVLFAVCAAMIIGVFIITVFNGLSMLGFVRLSPVSEYYLPLLLLAGIILIDFPLSFFVQKLLGKIFNLKKIIERN